MINKVKVTKGTITKEIQEKDLPQYISMGWKKVTDFNFQQQFQRVK